MACQTFFFLLPGKTGHREWYITDLQTQRGVSTHMGGLVLGKTQAPAQAGWRTPQLTCGIPLQDTAYSR